MFIKEIEDLDPFTPGLVIKPDGSIITMESENHATFFQNIIGNEFRKMGLNARSIIGEDNLKVLMNILLRELNILPYQGCESKTRIYGGGILYINELSSLNKEQLMSIINVYTAINVNYNTVICETDKEEKKDRYISIDEIADELKEKTGSIRK